MRAYSAGVRGSELGPLTTLESAVAWIHERVKATEGPWDLAIRGSDESERVHGDRRIRRRLLALGETLKIGDRLDARRVGGRRTYVIRCAQWKIGSAPAFPPVTHTEPVEKIWRYCFAETARIGFRLGRDLVFVQQGVYNCRRIDGSTKWSTHAWGAALDGHIANRKSGALDVEATSDLVAGLRAQRFVGLVLWLVSGHFGHFHAQESSPPSGIPPCAR